MSDSGGYMWVLGLWEHGGMGFRAADNQHPGACGAQRCLAPLLPAQRG